MTARLARGRIVPVWFLIVLVLAAGAVAAALHYVAPLPLELQLPQRGPAVQAVYATGTVEPAVMIPIAPRSAARLVTLDVDEGQRVQKDQVLARLEDSDLKRRVEELVARARYAREQYQRAVNMLQRGLGTVDERDRTRSELNAAEAAVDRARAEQEFMTLRAPADGEILKRDGEVGQFIPVNQPVFYLSCCAPLRVSAEVDEEDIPRVQVGQRTLIHADAFPDQVLEGRVEAVTPKGDPISRSYRVRVSLPPSSPLRIGMTVDTNIVIEERENVLLVPATAIVDGAVFVYESGVVHRRRVETGIVGERRVEIRTGLSGTAPVVVLPPTGLADGRRVAAPPPAD